jgi:hypothetical protein
MIYATLNSSQPGKYNSARQLRRIAAAAVLLSAAAAQGAPLWRDAPSYVALFAPAGPRAAAYRMYESAENLETVLRQLADDPALLRSPGAWEVRALAPTDAFGQAGPYDRSRVTRLYGAQRARVARGARVQEGRVTEAWALISPYPDVTLQRLVRGTLLVVLRYDFPGPS